MRVLVTGSAGRLGRSAAAVLAAEGHDVLGVDRLRAELPGVSELVADLGEPGRVAQLVSDSRPQAIVHLAAIAVPFSAPERDILRVNTQLAHDILEAAASNGVERVLCASSPTVIGYGDPAWRPERLPLDEQHPVAPANAYALSKVAVEEMVRMFSRSTDVVAGFFRPCYVITPEEWAGAPTQQGHTVRERLDAPALAAVSLFNYVDARDAGEFILRWLDAAPTVVDGEGFFVAAADSLARRPVGDLAAEHAPQLIPLVEELRGDAPVFSSGKAADLLGWTPRRSWRDARGEVIDESSTTAERSTTTDRPTMTDQPKNTDQTTPIGAR